MLWVSSTGLPCLGAGGSCSPSQGAFFLVQGRGEKGGTEVPYPEVPTKTPDTNRLSSVLGALEVAG